MMFPFQCWQATRKGKVETYNALLIFKDEEEANKVFERLQGDQEKVHAFSSFRVLST